LPKKVVEKPGKASKAPILKKVAPVPKKQKTAPIVEKKAEVKPLVNRKMDQAIASAKEKIGKIGSISDKISDNLKRIATPTAIESDLSFIDSKLTIDPKETLYRDELASWLKLKLKLPEYGEVKVLFTLDRLGNVVKVKILSFQSAKNAAYIEKELPKLQLPKFGSNFGDQQTYDFTILFIDTI
jgi:outer membrane biosynthesis protein TonB